MGLSHDNLVNVVPISVDDVRLSLHVLAATVWVGGQLVLAGLVPVLRPFGPEATRAAARRFNVVAWSAMAVLVATGVWNLAAIHVGDASTEYLVTLFVKLLAVGLSAAGAALHVLSRKTAALAIGGALSSLGGIAALFLGIVLH
jgi:putative copper export protein